MTSNLTVEIDSTTKEGSIHLTHGNLQKALASFEHAFQLSQRLNKDYTIRACALNVGAVHIALQQADLGLNYLQQALPPENQKDGKSNGDLYYNFGLAYESLKEDGEAVKYYELAYEEYQIEKDNVQMEAEVANRAGSCYGRLKSPLQSARSLGIAAKTYAQLQDFSMQAMCLCQQSLQLYKNSQLEEAIQSADDCLILCNRVQSQDVLGKLYNELGLIYSQCREFQKAATCFEYALPMIRKISKEKRCEAIVLQNLGAVYNSLFDYKKALSFHEQAAAAYAQVGSRSCQGQCFINLAFAYSQLGDTDTAGECYLHAVQAAKDGDDKRVQWQGTEGLGAVYFNQGNIEKAIAYFQLTLKILADAGEPNQMAQERIVAKLSDALQLQATLLQNVPEAPTKSSRPSTSQSLRTAYRPDILIRPPTREEQIQMQAIRSQMMLNKVPNELGHIAHGIGDYSTEDDLSVASSRKNRPNKGNRPRSAVPGTSRDVLDSRVVAGGPIVPETIKEETFVAATTRSAVDSGAGRMVTSHLNLHRRKQRPLLRPNKHNSEIEWNQQIRNDILSENSIIRQCLPGNSGDESFTYKERLNPKSSDEAPDTNSEVNSSVSNGEKQRNQNRVKEILRGKTSRSKNTKGFDSDDDSPNPIGLRTSNIPAPGQEREAEEISSSAGGKDEDLSDSDENTLQNTSNAESFAHGREGGEDLYNTVNGRQLVNDYRQQMRRLSEREDSRYDSEEESVRDSETVISEDFSHNKRITTPQLPTKSPPATIKINTYEEPVQFQGSPGEISESTDEDSNEEDEYPNKGAGNNKNYAKGNYFRRASPSEEDSKGTTLKSTVRDQDDPLYQTIRSVKDNTQKVEAVIETPPRQIMPSTSGVQPNVAPNLPPRPNQPLRLDEMSRGEQEEHLRKMHEQIVPLPAQASSKRNSSSKTKSKACLIM